MKEKRTEKRGGQEKSKGDDDIDDDAGDAEGDGDDALKQNGIKQVEFGG